MHLRSAAVLNTRRGAAASADTLDMLARGQTAMLLAAAREESSLKPYAHPDLPEAVMETMPALAVRTGGCRGPVCRSFVD